MEIRIEDGKTIISTGIGSNTPKNKNGVRGVNKTASGKYETNITISGKKYHLGNFNTIEEASQIRHEAEKQVEEGTFDEWFKSLNKKNTSNKYGVSGLYKKGNVYQMNISVNAKKYFLGTFRTIEEAKIVRAEADKHVEDGDFIEWYENTHKKRESNKYGVHGLYHQWNKYQLYIKYEGVKHFISSFDTVEEAAVVRMIAEAQRDAGTLLQWIESLKNNNKGGNEQKEKGSGYVYSGNHH